MIRLDRGGTFIALACLLIFLPYPVYRIFADERFGASYGSHLLHLGVAGCILGAIVLGYRTGWTLAPPQPRASRARSVTGGMGLLLWTPVILSIAGHMPEIGRAHV